MKVTLEEERTNEKPMLRNKLEDLQSQVEELNTRFKQDRKQRAFMFVFVVLFGLMFTWLALDIRAIKVQNISTNQKIEEIGYNFQNNTRGVTDLAAVIIIAILACLSLTRSHDKNSNPD